MTTTEIRPVPKSLHTITVIVQVAIAIATPHTSRSVALDRAMTVLGLADRPDPYEIKERAREILGA